MFSVAFNLGIRLSYHSRSWAASRYVAESRWHISLEPDSKRTANTRAMPLSNFTILQIQYFLMTNLSLFIDTIFTYHLGVNNEKSFQVRFETELLTFKQEKKQQCHTEKDCTHLTKSGALEMTCSNSANDNELSSSKSASWKICNYVR